MADDFTRMKFIWLDQVADDQDMKGHLSFHVSYIVSRHWNRATGDAWPSQQRLASACGVTVEAIRNAVARLVGNGHLKVTPAHGRGTSNRYLPIIKKAVKNPNPDLGKPGDKTPTAVVGSVNDTPAGVGDLNAEETPTAVVKNPNREPDKTPTAVVKNPNPTCTDTFEELFERETAEETSESLDERRASKLSRETAFEEWYAQYPRKVAKGAARKAFAHAVKKVDHRTLMASVLRFSAEREGKDPEKTPYPATWLNGERWLDEPTPEHKNPLTAAFDDLGDRIRRRSLTDIAIDGGDL